MKMRTLVTAISAILVGTAMLSGGVLAKGSKPVVEATNNLSYPGALTATATFTLPSGYYAFGAAFPNGMSWGCNRPETVGTSVYPNTSCVNDVGIPLTPEACVAPDGKCAGFEADALEPIYWQKNTANRWQAGYVSGIGSATADAVDWGDSLESVSWKTTSIIRVETNAFADLTLQDTSQSPQIRFDMWHVFGQGTNELWGAHANSANVPYVYATWPYAVIKTPYARLNMAKLLNGAVTCPPTGLRPDFPDLTWTHNVGWDGLYKLRDIPYTAELNIKGSYVFGYNWNLKSDVVPSDVNKAGWWRLTFYTTDDSVVFDDPTIPTVPPATTEPPVPMVTAEAEEGDTGPLYAPVVDVDNNLTYIDICIINGSSRGGGGGGGRR